MQGLNKANLCEFRCFVAKVEESEKAGSCQELNPGHLWLVWPVLCYCMSYYNHQPSQSSICNCTGGTECLSHTPGSYSVCAVRTPSEENPQVIEAQIGLEGSDIPPNYLTSFA